MAELAPIRRRLRIHAAHQSIGVGNCLSATDGWGELDDFSDSPDWRTPEPDRPENEDHA
ncbi:MAG: hypothetical protein ABFC63_02090 [Thermoguttaceae bacterium]